MEDTRLIMIEGLPGSGKSTKSHFLLMQLDNAEKPSRWIHEVARPHPVLFFDEACLTYDEYALFIKAHPKSEQVLNQTAVFRKNTVGIDLLELKWNYMDIFGNNVIDDLYEYDVWKFPLDKYMNVALDKWAYFVEMVLREEVGVYILDSSIFQYQIFKFILKNTPINELKQFMQKIVNIIKPLIPNLIYLYRENAEASINFLENLRGKQFLEGIWQRDKDEPYYIDKPKGAEGNKQFLRDYANIAEQLFDIVDFRKIAIDITGQDWESQETKILSFLKTERKTISNILPPNGVYRNEMLGIEIEVNGLSIKDPYKKIRSLVPKSECEFYVECLPVVLCFNNAEQITISGEQIAERWTTLGTQFIRV